MKSRYAIVFILLITLVPVVQATDFFEKFESQAPVGVAPVYKPDGTWYNYAEGDDVGNLTVTPPIPFGAVAFRVAKGVNHDASVEYSQFNIEIPAQMTQINFTVRGTPGTVLAGGTRQVISLESSTPSRKLVEFYLFCDEPVHNNACELKVRSEFSQTSGINYTSTRYDTAVNRKQFNVTLIPNWLTGQYSLTVNAVSLGTAIPMLELPTDFARLSISQYRSDIPMRTTFDNFGVKGGVTGTQSAVSGDAAEGILSFMYDMHFRSATSKFVFGFVLFIILTAAILAPMFALGKSNAIANAISFFTMLVIFWLIGMEIWPDWIGISLIIATAALVGLLLRRFVLGIRNASGGPGLIIGCLGYFIIASTLLGFSGYASDTITTPTSQVDGDGTQSQSFVGAVAECIITGGAFTFGLIGDCNQATVSGTWKAITDIFSWVRTAVNFLFQLLTFRLPIPVIFNMMIVLPPATALAVFGFQMVRGNST